METGSFEGQLKVYKGMTRIGRRLIEDFLLPALNDERYGDLLKWIDRDKRYFSIRWSHKNAAKWTLADTAVFQDWDKLKGHYHPEIKGYYMQAKQRFRAALYKLNTVRKLPCEDKHVKKYQLVLDHDKRKADILGRTKISRILAKKEECQKSIPTSVICKNTSYIEKPKRVFIEQPCSPPSPASSTKSENSDKMEEDRCVEEYQQALQKQLMHSNCCKHLRSIVTPKKENLPKAKYCNPVFKEIPKTNFMQKAPHVPIQPVPVYSKCFTRPVVDNSQRRYESPHLLLVPTYNDDIFEDTKVYNDDISNDSKEKLSNHFVSKQNSESVLNLSEQFVVSEQNSEGALNLSIKSESSDMWAR
ncbi:uncharacterized protein LOC118189894 isoform X2 [Stegodyphus dumicola]|uniref:uncharacterized protein LOC118189894 isoform X2 n=1 Tax=Stegodyphus dumicola TaxID=202533 RepID=UPI0015B201CD|nr:uncharacterized protein LOC118189894 isoform X2 [Stegodyphus dumicola]